MRRFDDPLAGTRKIGTKAGEKSVDETGGPPRVLVGHALCLVRVARRIFALLSKDEAGRRSGSLW